MSKGAVAALVVTAVFAMVVGFITWLWFNPPVIEGWQEAPPSTSPTGS
jgi:hypothetical protein